MDAKRYRQIRQLFDAVQEQPAERRTAYLAEAARGDSGLREEVTRLMRASDSDTAAFQHPAVVREGPGPLERWEGRRLGAYQVLRELGEGGMGIVYLARRADGAFQKEVAIKIVRRQLATPSFLQRFQREREILAKLEHPHIARLLDGGTSPAFLAMEYVKGEPLLAYADARRLSFDGRLALLRQVASAIDYAHREGVVHRDLKPANIFVTAEGEVKLLDFGIAAWQQSPADREFTPTLAMSPPYASPEQVRGDKTNASTDVYSFGLVAYELLAGTPAFRLEEAALEEMLRMILETTPPPPSVAVRRSKSPAPADLGRRRQMAPVELIERLEGLDDPLMDALSKRREDRPESASALMAKLERGSAKHKTIPDWLEWLAAQWDFAAVQVFFAALAWSGEFHLSRFAWFTYAWLSVAILLRRSGVLGRLYNLSPTMVLAAGAYTFVFGAAVVSGTRQHFASGVTKGLAIPVGFLLFDLVHYYSRRASRLGKVLISSRSHDFGRFWAALFLGVTGKFAWNLLTGEEQPLAGLTLIALGFWFCWKVSLKPLEVRERGLVVPSALLSWSSIRDYCWLKPTQLEVRIHSTILRGISYLRVQVRAEDHDQLQAVLQNWLMEKPGEDAEKDYADLEQ